MSTFHGPRATIIAPPGRCFLGFDADGLHLRIAGCMSQDPFIQGAIEKYDATGDPVWKPHIQNTAALFQITPEEAVGLMNVESPKYTFSKNFIYTLLNGGEAPALANAAVSAGLEISLADVQILLDNWLARAIIFHRYRLGLVEEAERTGQVTMPGGRRRRFYGLRKRQPKKKKVDPHADRYWVADHETVKEIYNTPLIQMEVEYMNPKILQAFYWTLDNPPWLFIYHGHDGFMLEGPIEEGTDAAKAILKLFAPYKLEVDHKRTLYVPFEAKLGVCMADLGKLKGLR